MSQQLGPAVERATSPYQYAMTTKAGCEFIAHALQGLTELDPEATITSIDGVRAFDLISRRAVLEGLQRVSAEAVPFARMFYGRGEVHNIPQGEGGEQGDAMMPLLFSLGQHGALQNASRTLGHGEHLMAFLDDTYYVSEPARVGPIYGSLENALWRNAGIRIHVGKTQIWNQAGIRPPICDALERSARAVDPTATVWRGSMLPTDRQGIKFLGTPLGHPDFVAKHLRSVTEQHQVLLQRFPRVRDLQSARLLLLHCASARANYFLRAVDPGSSVDFARTHDEDIWQCTCDILHVDPVQARSVKEVASLPLVLGGLGLRSAERVRVSAFWASWADCNPTIHTRHPVVADALVRQLEGHPHTSCLRAASVAAWSLHGILGWSPPSWTAVRDGTRPETRQPEEHEPGSTRGW